MSKVEELLEHLMRDPDFRDQYSADPDKCLAEAGIGENDQVALRQLDVDVLCRGAFAEQRRSPGVDSAAQRGGSA